MVSVSNVSLALIAASTALISAVQANQYASLADWKKTSYYKEACDKKFLPLSSIPSSGSDDSTSGSASTTGEFSMAAGSGDSTFIAEEKKRFEQALADIEELQKLHPHATFSLNTPFALMSHDEFLAYVNRNNINPDLNPLHRPTNSAPSSSTNSSAPMTGAGATGSTTSASGVDGGPKTGAAAAGETVDWQQQGCVTAVKDQAQCGACWAFSATAAMESGVCVETGGTSLPVLADQELISCDNQGQSQGCGGGFASYTMDWIAQSRAGKMCTLASYPFASSDGSVPSCKLSSCSEVDIGVTGFLSIRKDPGALEDAVRSRPVSVFLYSGSKAFQYYSGGILTGENCDKTGAHSGLAVGFGEENGTPYWRVKNQWGTNWGEAGYVRIQRRYAADDEGACGVELYASYPTFKSGVTAAPTSAPTAAPTAAPTVAPTAAPTAAPTQVPTAAPTVAPTQAPTAAPTVAPTQAPTAASTVAPTSAPAATTTAAPTAAPTVAPSPASTSTAPTQAPTKAPAPAVTPAFTKVSTSVPTPAPTQSQIELPTPAPTKAPTAAPVTAAPTPAETNPFLAPVLPDPYQGEAPTPAPTTMTAGDDAAAVSGSFQEGVDFLGNDVFNSSASSVSECSTLCKATAGCNAFTFTTWKNGWCWQKSRAGLVVPSANAVSGSFHDISKCTRQNTPQEYGYEYPGNDLSEVAASKAADCYALCSDVAQCHAFTWSKKNGGICALKTRKVPAATYHAPTDSEEFISAIVYKCKQIQFNSDFEGQDIGNAPARSPEACCTLCHAVKGCAGFAWNAFETGTCWFKSGTANKVTKGSVVAASI